MTSLASARRLRQAVIARPPVPITPAHIKRPGVIASRRLSVGLCRRSPAAATQSASADSAFHSRWPSRGRSRRRVSPPPTRGHAGGQTSPTPIITGRRPSTTCGPVARRTGRRNRRAAPPCRPATPSTSPCTLSETRRPRRATSLKHRRHQANRLILSTEFLSLLFQSLDEMLRCLESKKSARRNACKFVFDRL